MSLDNEYGITLEELVPEPEPQCGNRCGWPLTWNGVRCMNPDCDWLSGPDDDELEEAA